MMILTNGEGRVGMKPARDVLMNNGSALDVVEQGIRAVEADVTVRSVGRGGDADLLGEVACDAAIMDGATLQVGAVGDLKGCLHPISVAREVLLRLPHVLLVGEGASRFSQEVGAEEAQMLTEEALVRHRRWLESHLSSEDQKRWPHVPLAEYAWASGEDLAARGTTVFLAIDSKGDMAVGASTSGWAQRYPGRLGDTPIVGAGLYADNRHGACACTHTGEMTIRAGTSRSVVLYMKAGASVQEACHEAIKDLRQLRGGYIGPVVIHATDSCGNICVLSSHDLPDGLSYHHWAEDEERS